MTPFNMRHYRFLLLLTACLPVLAFAQTTAPCAWNPDHDGDNAIGVNDLLALLGVFEEVDADMDGIFDSQDSCVGIYDACGECNGSGLDLDMDGICDDTDPCVGALDECGVCNGPGANFPVLDEIIYATDSVFLTPLGTWFVFSYPVDTLYNYVCFVEGCMDSLAGNYNPTAVFDDGSCTYGPAQCGGQSMVTFDGYDYALVGIGEQCWFKENLRSDNYSNGDVIPGSLSAANWNATLSGAYTVYDNNATNSTVYGQLYNWFAVNDSRGLCPIGFHVPSDEEWYELENFLGGSSVAGIALKASTTDSPPWDGTNVSGFNGLPAGYRSSSGLFFNLGNYGLWWSSTPFGEYGYYRFLFTSSSAVNRLNTNPRFGLSVRCIQD
jgi:uncharacterized protein (TIGR02145 family)